MGSRCALGLRSGSSAGSSWRGCRGFRCDDGIKSQRHDDGENGYARGGDGGDHHEYVRDGDHRGCDHERVLLLLHDHSDGGLCISLFQRS